MAQPCDPSCQLRHPLVLDTVGSKPPPELPGYHLRPKREAGHSRLAGGKLEGTYEACLEQPQDISVPAHQNLKVYRGPNWVQSRTPSRWSQNHISVSGLCPWGSSGTRETSRTHSRGGGSPRLPRSGSRVHGRSHLLHDLLPQTPLCYLALLSLRLLLDLAAHPRGLGWVR